MYMYFCTLKIYYCARIARVQGGEGMSEGMREGMSRAASGIYQG